MNEAIYLERIQVSVMFCDDVRIERDGQVNYIGVYQPHLTVKEFPYTFRTFTAVLTLLAPVEVVAEPIVFRVRRNKAVIMEYSPEAHELPGTSGHDLRMSINMATEAFEVKEQSTFSAEIMIGDKTYLSRTVLIVSTKPFEGKTLQDKGTRKLVGDSET